MDFEMYMLGNWEGIKESSESLGAIEGQVYHHLARRMKRLGARWTTDGADRMARLCGAKANGELSKYSAVSAKPARKLEPRATSVCKEAVDNLDEVATEIGDWLKAKVPALEGPYQSRSFVKYVLRQIVLGRRVLHELERGSRVSAVS